MKPLTAENRITLKELVAKEQIFAPCVWDCVSTKVAEAAGFKAVLLSSAAVGQSLCGMPDTGLITANELVGVTERIANTSPLPIIVDGDEGYGDSPLNVFRTCQRLANAGAMAISIDDTTGIRGWERLFYKNGYEYNVCSKENFLAKINAAVEGVRGTECMIIARTAAKRFHGIDEAIDRMVRAEKLGAHMTMVLGIHTIEECRKINEKLPGWKMYPDVVSHNGVSDVNLDEIAKLGFNLVTCHFLEQGSIYGMMKFAKENLKNRNTVYSDTYDMGDVDIRKVIDFGEWMSLEAHFRDDI